ncbi:MAG: Holliday junction resolvase RecU [Firmicutes bacterium]|nr:Holliday junction resolvase RecU [Bacillota bacterium]
MTTWKSFGHRGDVLEELIIFTNEQYRKRNLGRIDKVPTPVTVTQIDNQGRITKAFFEKKGTVDFNGLIQGIGVYFDAKETEKKSLPLANIHKHQIDYMVDMDKQNGLAFILAHFKYYNEYYLIPLEVLLHYYNNSLKGGRKSIPYKALNKDFLIVKSPNGVLDYLPVLNIYLNYKKNKKFKNL